MSERKSYISGTQLADMLGMYVTNAVQSCQYRDRIFGKCNLMVNDCERLVNSASCPVIKEKFKKEWKVEEK